MVYSGAWGKLIHKKTWSRKSRGTVSLTGTIPRCRKGEPAELLRRACQSWSRTDPAAFTLPRCCLYFVDYFFFIRTTKVCLIDSIADPGPYVLGLPDLDPLVKGTDPDPDPSIIKQKYQEKPWFLLFMTSIGQFFIFEKLCKCSFKR